MICRKNNPSSITRTFSQLQIVWLSGKDIKEIRDEKNAVSLKHLVHTLILVLESCSTCVWHANVRFIIYACLLIIIINFISLKSHLMLD